MSWRGRSCGFRRRLDDSDALRQVFAITALNREFEIDIAGSWCVDYAPGGELVPIKGKNEVVRTVGDGDASSTGCRKQRQISIPSQL